MDFDALVEGPLLWTASIVFVFGIIARIVFFLIVSVKRNHKSIFASNLIYRHLYEF